MSPASAPAPALRGEAAHRDAGQSAPKLAPSQAFALGLLHGPCELLPISSSAHTALVPWLAGWRYGELDPDLRKSFEVALHAGTAFALLLRPPTGRLRGGKPIFLLAAVTPPALAGYALGSSVERRLGTPGTIAAGLLAGSAAIAAGEVFAHKGCLARARARAHTATVCEIHDTQAQKADWRDGLALGLAQACALFPGVSRSGASLASARACGFSRLDADRLSWQTGLPVIAAATALKSLQLARRGTPPELRLPFAAGAAGSLLSTLASSALLTPPRRARLLGACALYRGVLALFVVRRMRDNTDRHAQPSKK